MKRLLMALLGVTSLIAMSFIPVDAGGWVTVRLDTGPEAIVSGEMQTLELSVWAHDREEIDVERFVLKATHVESGDEIVREADHAGSSGHYTIDVTFTSPGDWHLVAQIPPYPEFALPSLVVLSGTIVRNESSGSVSLALGTGSCDRTDADTTPIDTLALGGQGQPLWGQINRSLTDLVSSSNVLLVRGARDVMLSCAEFSGASGANRVVVPLSPGDGRSEAGLAVLDADGEQTSITFYPVSVTPPQDVVEISIVGESGEDWRFEPAVLEVEPGTMVVWRNQTHIPHTVTGTSIDFKTSGIIAPGESFAQVFYDAGTYSYFSGPHQWMNGSVIVEL